MTAADAGAPYAGDPQPADPQPVDPRALLDRARRLSEAGHPAALEEWRRLADAVRGAEGALNAAERAELIDHRAMAQARTDPAGGADRFAEAARLHAEAGDAGQAVAASARAALSTAFAGRPEEALRRLEELCAEAASLHSAGRAGLRDATAVLLSRARVRELLLPSPVDPGTAADSADTAAAADSAASAAALDAELADLVAFAEPGRSEPAVLARIADATESRARLAARLEDGEAAVARLREAAALYHAAGRPWQATGAEVALAERLLAGGRADEAESALRTALAAADPETGPPEQSSGPEETGTAAGAAAGDAAGAGTPRRPAADVAQLHLVLSGALAAQQRFGAQADALDAAARWADAAGEQNGRAARTRLQLGGLRLSSGEPQAAAEALEQALDGLLAGGHDGARTVRARWLLGQAYAESGGHEEAAQQFLAAAETVRRDPETYAAQAREGAGAEEVRHGGACDHALLVHLAADELRACGRAEDAAAVYEHAERLWRPLGDTCALVRALRSRAWLALGASGAWEAAGGTADEAAGAYAADGEERAAGSAAATAAAKAVELMAGALREMETGLQTARDPEQRLQLQLELGRTYQQSAELLLHTAGGPLHESRDGPERHAADRAVHQEAVVHAEHALTVFRGCGEPGQPERAGAELLLAGLEAELGKREPAAARARAVLAALADVEADPLVSERRAVARELLARLGVSDGRT